MGDGGGTRGGDGRVGWAHTSPSLPPKNSKAHRSVKSALNAKRSDLDSAPPSGSLRRILYLAHDRECSSRVTSSSGRLSRWRTSAYESSSASLKSKSAAACSVESTISTGRALKLPLSTHVPCV